MHSKIWTELELRKRDEIAESAFQSIVNSKHPRQMANFEMPRLIEYEILPQGIVLDDDIREFAKSKISPPRRLSKAAIFDYYNKFPSLSVEQCVMLSIDVEPGTPIRTQAEKNQYYSTIQLAESYLRINRKPFVDDHSGPIETYQIAPDKFIAWVKSSGIEIPEQWKPVVADAKPEKKKSRLTQDLCVAELREAAVQLCVKKVRQGIARQYITVKKISKELYEDGQFHNGDLFSTQWRTSETIRGYLKDTNNPKWNERYKIAKPNKPTSFN